MFRGFEKDEPQRRWVRSFIFLHGSKIAARKFSRHSNRLWLLKRQRLATEILAKIGNPESMKRSENRILTTHVGSIVRPQKLRDLPRKRTKSPENRKRYEDFLRDSVAEVVKMQAEVGIDIVSDGEYGKSSWSNYILNGSADSKSGPTNCAP